MHDFHDCWFLTGPTASGKTSLGLTLAQRLDAEIISMDSMALYRGMDIGTAKPSPAEQAEVPHHLIDVIEPHEEFSLAQYVDAAAKAAQDIRARGQAVLFVGGTPLYLKALLRGIFEGPPADWDFRRRLRDEAATAGPEILHKRLAQVDALTAERLHPNDMRRVIRALEVFEKTGQPISQLQQQFEQGRSAEESRVFVLDWPREILYQRIDDRVRQMFDAGLVDEVRGLLASPQDLSRTASQALGYREVIDHLSQGINLTQTVELTQTHTRQFAKRQGTWFRSLTECRFLEVATPLNIAVLANKILQLNGSA